MEKMRSLVPGLPVIICSGRVEEVASTERRKPRIFRKPVDAPEFLRAVTSLLTGKAIV